MKKALVCVAVAVLVCAFGLSFVRASGPSDPSRAISISKIEVQMLEGYDDAIVVSANLLTCEEYVCPVNTYGAPLPVDFYLEVRVKRFDATSKKWEVVDMYLLNAGKAIDNDRIAREIYGVNPSRYKYTFKFHASFPGNVYAYSKEDKKVFWLGKDCLSWTNHEPLVWCQNCDWRIYNDPSDPLNFQTFGISCHSKSLYLFVGLEGVTSGEIVALNVTISGEEGNARSVQACAVNGEAQVDFYGLESDREYTISIQATNFRKTIWAVKTASTIADVPEACK